jgi:hypothetical protein
VSYDVTLFVPAGTGSLEEQLAALDAMPEPPTGIDDEKRLRALIDDLRSRDSAAEIEEDNVGGRLAGFVVADSESLPDIGVRGRTARLAMSLGSDSHALYESLHEMVVLFHAQGYVAYDYQLGGFVEPADDFRQFMQQFASQWDSPQGLAQWLTKAADDSSPVAEAQAPTQPAAPRKGPPMAAIIFGVFLLLWALYKLHKAGYF